MRTASPSTLLERDQPLSTIVELVDRLERGSGRCLLLEGEAGVGKTSLLAAARERTRSRTDWWWGACDPLLAPPPLAPWFDLLPQLPPSLGDAVRRGRVDADLYTGLLGLLRDAARPVVLVIEDAHWADSASIDLLRYLARRIGDTSALLVLSWRSAELTHDHPLQVALAGLPPASTRRLAVQPLSPGAVKHWATQAGRDPGGLYEATGGNPFYVEQVLAAPVSGQGVPPAVQDAVLSRVARQSAPVREVLDLVSLSPVALELDVLAVACRPAPEHVDAAVRCGLLRLERSGHGQGLRFAHELARLAVAAAVGARAQALHGRLYDALGRQRDVAVARRVHHAEHAGLAQAVVQLAPDAARAASLASAHRQAAALYALALGHAHLLDRSTEALLAAAHADECLLINDVDRAAASCNRALALARADGNRVAEGRQLRVLARIEWTRGRQAEGVALAAQALSVLRDAVGHEAREHAMACLTMGQLHLLGDDPLVARRWVDRALPHLRAAGDLEAEAYALHTAGAARLGLGQTAAGIAQLDRALALARKGGLDELAGRIWSNRVAAALVQQQLGEVESLCAHGLEYCEARDLDIFAIHLRMRQALGWIAAGRWGEGAGALAALRDRPDLNALQRGHLAWLCAFMALRRDEPGADTAWRALAEDGPPLDPPPWYFDATLMHVEAAWLCREAARARALAEHAWTRRSRRRDPWRRAQLAVWLHRLGGAGAVAAAEPDWPAAAVLSVQGQHEAAAQAWGRLGNPYEQALALADGSPAQAKQALTLLTAIGAQAAARRVRDRLHQLGERAVPRGPYAHARDDPLGLTRRQREVLEALARGLSNREIAHRLHRSERTIEQHVAALIEKLEASDRHDAVRRAHEKQVPKT